VGQIEAANERDRIVDHHDLLVVRGAHGVLVVEPERKPRVGAPVELVKRHPLAVHREHHREIPRQHAHAKPRLALYHLVQEIAELFGVPVVRAGRNQTDAAVDVPADDIDTALRIADGGTDRSEVIGAVDQKSDALGVLYTPAIAAGYEKSIRAGALGVTIHGSGFSGGAECRFAPEWQEVCLSPALALGSGSAGHEQRETFHGFPP
jgi:hypothetical protein